LKGANPVAIGEMLGYTIFMLFDQDIFVGVDPAAGNPAFIWVALDARKEVVASRNGSQDELIQFIQGIPRVSVAINSPRTSGLHLMDDITYRQGISPIPRTGRFLDYRVCEYLLRVRNIRILPVPLDVRKAPGWMMHAFILYNRLEKIPVIRTIEVQAHACFCALLGKIPFLKNTLEGRIQRQLVLVDQKIHIPEPMDFFEEITRRRLLQGVLPNGILKSARELDALVSAFTVWQQIYQPEQTMALGDLQEGQIILPVGVLKDKYE
jgi:hypothetical protein